MVEEIYLGKDLFLEKERNEGNALINICDILPDELPLDLDDVECVLEGEGCHEVRQRDISFIKGGPDTSSV